MNRTLIKESPTIKELGMLPCSIVLCKVKGNHEEYVTWAQVVNEDGTKSTFWGHYFKDLGKAVKDFDDRAAKYYKEAK